MEFFILMLIFMAMMGAVVVSGSIWCIAKCIDGIWYAIEEKEAKKCQAPQNGHAAQATMKSYIRLSTPTSQRDSGIEMINLKTCIQPTSSAASSNRSITRPQKPTSLLARPHPPPLLLLNNNNNDDEEIDFDRSSAESTAAVHSISPRSVNMVEILDFRNMDITSIMRNVDNAISNARRTGTMEVLFRTPPIESIKREIAIHLNKSSCLQLREMSQGVFRVNLNAITHANGSIKTDMM